MTIFKVLIILILPIIVFSEEYTPPKLNLLERKEVNIEMKNNSNRLSDSEIFKERTPSSSDARSDFGEVEHWKIQEIIDRYDSH